MSCYMKDGYSFPNKVKGCSWFLPVGRLCVEKESDEFRTQRARSEQCMLSSQR